MTCAVQLLANGRNKDVKCDDFHTTLHSEIRTANDRLVSGESHMTWSEVTHYHEAEGRP